MASVAILRAPICSDAAAEVPRDQWGELMRERKRFCTQYLPMDCRNLIFFVEDGAANGWVGYQSRERYIREGLGLEPETVNWAVIGLQQSWPDEAIELNEAVVLGKHGRAEDDPRDESGRFLPNPPKADNIRSGDYGTSATYTLARLDRDRPELAARVRSHELSANAAAIEAGFRKPPTPLQTLRSAWKKANAEERATFLNEVAAE